MPAKGPAWRYHCPSWQDSNSPSRWLSFQAILTLSNWCDQNSWFFFLQMKKRLSVCFTHICLWLHRLDWPHLGLCKNDSFITSYRFITVNYSWHTLILLVSSKLYFGVFLRVHPALTSPHYPKGLHLANLFPKEIIMKFQTLLSSK